MIIWGGNVYLYFRVFSLLVLLSRSDRNLVLGVFTKWFFSLSHTTCHWLGYPHILIS